MRGYKSKKQQKDEKDLCNNVPFVCEKWKLASSHSLLVKNAYFEGKTTKEICFVLVNAPLLESVTLVSCNDTVPVMRQISRRNMNVKTLILRECSSNGGIIPEEVLINVMTSLPELHTIELYHTRFKSRLFFDLVAALTNITTIDLSLNEFITLDDLMKLAHNSQITEFKLSRRFQEPKISDEGMSHLIRTMSQRLVLLHLDMGGVGGGPYNEILRCTKLVDLKLNSAMNLSANVLKEIPFILRKIKHLSIEGPTQGLNKGDVYISLFSNTGFGEQLESLKLKKLDSLNDDECYNVIKSCPNLRVLSLKGCQYLTFQGIVRPILNSIKLKHLNIAFLGKLSNLINLENLSELRELVIDEVSLNQSQILNPNKKLNIIKLS